MTKKNVEPEYLLPPLFDADGVQFSSGIGVDGKEYPDPVPMAPPVGYTPPPDLMQMIRSMIRAEDFRKKLEDSGYETFEESDDFETDDGELFDHTTPYEEVFYPEDERSAPGPHGLTGPQAGVSAPLAAPEPVKGSDKAEGAVASPPPVKSEKAA